jgi:phage terminase large subunit-like protein
LKKLQPPHPTTKYALDVTNGKIPANRWVFLACKRHLNDLKVGKERGLYFDIEAANHAIAFFPEFLCFYEGDFSGKPFNLTPHQKFVVGSIFGWKKIADDLRRFKTAYIEEAKGNGKALWIETPIPTLGGWKKMGELAIGDIIFDDRGRKCKIINCTDTIFGKECYKITFSDGGEIIADKNHLWQTNRLWNENKRGDALRGVKKENWKKHNKNGEIGIWTTGEIHETLSARPSNSTHPQAKWNHRIDSHEGLQINAVDLPIKPYTLGIWLGDGDSDSARITTADMEILHNIREDGYELGVRQRKKNSKAFRVQIGLKDNDKCRRGHAKSYNRSGKKCLICERENDHYRRNNTPKSIEKNISLTEILRNENLIHNKHIPNSYLRSGTKQREELLQGIMDSDGFVSKTGQCEIVLTNERLIDDVLELIRTMGIKCTKKESEAKLNDRIVGRRWRITFHTYKNQNLVRLKRKRERLKYKPATRPLSRGKMIIGCERISSVPVRCIEVDSPSRLYLAGENFTPTHNSPLAGGIGLYGLTFDDEPGAEIYAAAVTKEQAGILFRDAHTFAEGSPELSDILIIDKNNIAYLEENSFFRAISSEHRGLDGKRPHIALIDEIHEHPNDLVVRKMSAGTKTRRQALIFEITNSGYDRHSICYQHHEYTEKILEGIIEDDTWFGMMSGLDVCNSCRDDGKTIPQDGCPDCDDWKDPITWEKANPNLKYLGKPFLDYLQKQVNEAKEMPSQQNIVKRLNFCIWTESHTRWISSDRWNKCNFTVIPEKLKGMTCYSGLDLSSNIDLTALVHVFPPVEVLHSFEGNRKLYGSPDKYQIICRFFMPEDNVRDRVHKDKVPYDVWINQGYITTTPGNIIDYKFILNQLKYDQEQFLISELAFDRWGSQKITTDLQDECDFKLEGDEKTLIQFGQGYASMSSPTNEVEKMVLAEELAHSANPVLTWMMSNVVIKQDPAGNKKPDKEKSTEKIDGAVALIMAIARAMMQNIPEESAYKDLSVEDMAARMAF